VKIALSDIEFIREVAPNHYTAYLRCAATTPAPLNDYEHHQQPHLQHDEHYPSTVNNHQHQQQAQQHQHHHPTQIRRLLVHVHAMSVKDLWNKRV